MNGFTFEIGPGYTSPVDVQAAAFPEEFWFRDAVGGYPSDSGERVNATTALSHCPVWQAVNVLAGDLGQLPWHKMLRSEDNRGAEKDREHPLEWLIAYQPNGFQSPSEWRECVMATALLWGNSVSVINRNAQGERELIPLDPSVTTGEADSDFGYLVSTRVGGKTLTFAPWQVFHIKGLATNGWWGQGVVSVAKNVIGHGLALQKHGNRVFKNGARPSGVLQHPSKLSPEARANLRAEWEAIHSGSDNAGRIAILWEDMKFNPMSMSNEDAQWLDARRMDREQVASLFNLPAFKLNALEHSAVRANLEEQNRDYFNTSLARWLNKFNQEAERKLLSMRERRSKLHFFKFSPEGFLKGDIQKRYAAYSQAITARFMSPNEVRALEDMNPYEGGDEYLNPAIDTAGGSGSTQPADPNTSNNAAAQQLVRKQVALWCENEARTVEKACTEARNLCKWAANYYEKLPQTAENYLAMPAEIAKQAGFSGDWKAAIERHAIDGLQRLLAAAGMAQKSDLPEVGKELSEAIRGQAETLAAAILGDCNG